MTMRDTEQTEFIWNGVLDPSQYGADALQARHRLADAAKAGDWPMVLRLLDKLTNGTSIEINETGTSLRYAPGVLQGGVLEHDSVLSECREALRVELLCIALAPLECSGRRLDHGDELVARLLERGPGLRRHAALALRCRGGRRREALGKRRWL
jgi:hypothetical protein